MAPMAPLFLQKPIRLVALAAQRPKPKLPPIRD